MIQKILLSEIPGYLGTYSKIDYGKDYVEEFRNIAPVHPFLHSNDEEINQWIDSIIEYMQSNWPDINRLIISEENLSARKYENGLEKWGLLNGNIQHHDVPQNDMINRPIIPFISKLANTKWKHGKTKVFIVLRNQSDWLGSIYAQQSKFIKNATQKNFESSINNILDNNIDLLNWSKWVEDLYDSLGSDNVCVLLMEEMGTREYWEKFIKFIGIKNLEPDNMIKLINKKENVRRVKEDVWKLQKWHAISGSTRRLIKNKWNPNNKPHLRLISMNLAKCLFVLDYPARFLIEGKRDKKISISSELKLKIKNKCKGGNEKLARLLGKNIEEYGY